MNNQQKNNSLSIDSLKAKIAILENKLADKDSVIADKKTTISKLSTDLDAARFQNEQLRRMIFGAKRERFESKIDSHQLILEFEPKTAEIEEAVKAEREIIRVDYERKKPKKKHLGRNTNTPSIDILVKIAHVFNVSVDYLIGEGQLSSYDKEVLKRIEDIENLDQETRKNLFFLINNVIQNFKTKQAFGK